MGRGTRGSKQQLQDQGTTNIPLKVFAGLCATVDGLLVRSGGGFGGWLLRTALHPAGKPRYTSNRLVCRNRRAVDACGTAQASGWTIWKPVCVYLSPETHKIGAGRAQTSVNGGQMGLRTSNRFCTSIPPILFACALDQLPSFRTLGPSWGPNAADAHPYPDALR